MPFERSLILRSVIVTALGYLLERLADSDVKIEGDSDCDVRYDGICAIPHFGTSISYV